MKHAIVYATSDCTLEDAIRVVSLYDIGSWASVNMGSNKEAFVIKTSDSETTLHTPIRFGHNQNEMMFRMEDGRVYTWDDFWQKMIDIYNLKPDNNIIVEEDDLY